MKYFFTFIVSAIITLGTTNAKKRPKPGHTTTITFAPPPWRPWNGKYPFSAQEIVQNATSLFYSKTRKYFKLMNIVSKETRSINGSRRYSVIYDAAKCILGKPKKCKKRGKTCKGKGKINIVGWVRKNTLFQAILKDNKFEHKLILNVTNLEDDESYEKIYNRPAKQIYRSM